MYPEMEESGMFTAIIKSGRREASKGFEYWKDTRKFEALLVSINL